MLRILTYLHRKIKRLERLDEFDIFGGVFYGAIIIFFLVFAFMLIREPFVRIKKEQLQTTRQEILK